MSEIPVTEAAPKTARFGPRVLVPAVACVVAVGGTGAWLALGSGGGSGACTALVKDPRIERALGDAYEDDLSCEDLGEAIQEAAVGDEPQRRHSKEQAQAMKSVIYALDDEIRRAGPGQKLHAELRGPVAAALADYVVDTHRMLGVGDAQYTRNASPADDAWEAKDGFHMAVLKDPLLRVMRAVSDDPDAYVRLRTAETRYAADELAAVDRKAAGFALSVPPSSAARAFAALDAVATDVMRDRTKEEADAWQRSVIDALADDDSDDVPSFEDRPAEHITGTWRKGLATAKAEERAPYLERQGADMTRIWGQARGMKATALSGLVNGSVNRADAARVEFLGRLAG
ncbi:hypothetical protein [Streptomyces sp. NPDC047928]|uniref:hypothetical protein n=1 Tax=unclassified Streptomyces TaxID=2593676 RepID=UPI00371A5F6C